MVRDALPCKSASDRAFASHKVPVFDTREEPKKKTGLTVLLWLFAIIGFSGCFVGHGWNGIQFLLFYGTTFFVLIASAYIIRHGVDDRYIVSVIHFLVFEAIGFARLHYGLTHGMHRFSYLIIMMILGGACFFLRAKSDDGKSYGFFGGCGIYMGSNGGCDGGCGGGCGGCGGCGD